MDHQNVDRASRPENRVRFEKSYFSAVPMPSIYASKAISGVYLMSRSSLMIGRSGEQACGAVNLFEQHYFN